MGSRSHWAVSCNHQTNWHAVCREGASDAIKSESMPPALAYNGTILQSEPVLPPSRPAFGQVQDTALQHDTSANNIGPQSHRLQTSSSYEHTASVNSADHYTFPAVNQRIEHRGSLGNTHTSDVSPLGGHSLSDGIPPAFETTSSCASASVLSPVPGRHFSINLATGMSPLCSVCIDDVSFVCLHVSSGLLPAASACLADTASLHFNYHIPEGMSDRTLESLDMFLTSAFSQGCTKAVPADVAYMLQQGLAPAYMWAGMWTVIWRVW